jgi:hypothetical protein
LLRALAGADVEYVLLGGVAVIAHGVIRTTRDVDICPAPDLENLQRLASMLRELGVRQLGEGEDFDEVEMPYDPTRAEDLAEGGNFRLRTPHGALDIMQWVPGIDAENAYAILASAASDATAFGHTVRVCSLDHLRHMKRVAGRPRDLQDLADLAAAHPEAGD